MENYKTIKELADELDISKQAVRKYFDKMPTKLIPKIIDGRYALSKDTVNYIRNRVSKVDTAINQVDSTENQPIDRKVDTDKVFDLTEKLLLEKDSRILFLENQNENLNKLLDQQQQLTLQSNKQIESLQQQLLVSTQSNEKEEETTGTKETPEDQTEPLEETVQEEIKSESKKWWQLWK